jgi:hypothetical protein
MTKVSSKDKINKVGLVVAAESKLAKQEAILKQEAQEFIESRPKVEVTPIRTFAKNPGNFVGGNIKLNLDKYGRPIRLINIVTPLT